MSTFGGDSWAREAQYRKRRVDDAVVEGLDRSSYKKLSGRKYACLVCPHNPVLDTPLMLSMHIKGSRHRAAESRLKERQLVIQDEIKKRTALSDCSVGTGESSKSTRVSQHHGLATKPLIEKTRTAASEILCYRIPRLNETKGNNDVQSEKDGPSESNNRACLPEIGAAGKFFEQQQSDLQERQERELKFTAAGWKRDCHGKWYKDANVSFFLGLSLILTKKIQMSVLHDQLRNHVNTLLLRLHQDR